MNSINFDNPYLLFLAIPIAALFIIPYAIAIRKDNLNGHNIASGIIHIIMALLIAFVAAGTSIVTTLTETDVYVVADVSYSAHRNLDTIDDIIDELGDSLPKNSRLGVVTFGKDYELLTRLGDKPKSVKSSTVDDSATDIISALAYTGSLFREDVIKRIVLITDGKQTSETDANALKRQVDALAESNIHVDAIYLDDNISPNAKEVQLSSVEVKPKTFLNRDASAKLTVNCSSSAEVSALLSVSRKKLGTDGEPEESTVSAYFSNGTNSYTLPLYTDEEGVYDYTVEIKFDNAEVDANPYNNVLTFTQEVSGKLKVLLIYDNYDDVRLIKSAYGSSAEIEDYYYASGDIGTTVEWLNKYDEIALASVDLTNMYNYSNFLRSLDKVVSTFGKSLVTFGDTNIQNSQGKLTALSNMLPVSYGKAAGEEKLVTIVIDTSRSMESLQRLDKAKEAAMAILDILENDDVVSVVQFNGAPEVVTRLAELGKNKDNIKNQIKALDVRQSTNIVAALDAAAGLATSTMEGKEFGERRLFLISDGMNYSLDEESRKIEDVVTYLRSSGVVTSALDVGRAGYDAANAARGLSLLKSVANKGGGEWLDISSPDKEKIRQVLESELPNDINNSSGDTSAIFVKRRADKMLQNVDTDELQGYYTWVNNFVYSRPKTSTTVLEVEYRGSSQDRSTNVPLYAYWSYGKGMVASFTTEITGNWMDMSSELREQLVKGILDTNVPEEKISEPFTLNIEATEGYAALTLEPDDYNPDAITTIEITSPNGKTTRPAAFANNGSEFTYTFLTPDEGKYTLKINYQDDENGNLYTLERAVHVAYSSEYDSFALYDASSLHKMIGSNGEVYNGSFTIVNDENEVGLYSVSLAMPLLIACVVLYAVDIAVRKLKWEDIQSLFKRHKKVKKQ